MQWIETTFRSTFSGESSGTPLARPLKRMIQCLSNKQTFVEHLHNSISIVIRLIERSSIEPSPAVDRDNFQKYVQWRVERYSARSTTEAYDSMLEQQTDFC